MIELIAQYLETIEQRPVTAAVKPGDIRSTLPEHPPTSPESFDDVLRDVNNIVLPGLTHWRHPNFYAFFPGNSSYPSILAARWRITQGKVNLDGDTSKLIAYCSSRNGTSCGYT